MESLFVILTALIVAVRSISPALAEALEVVVQQMRDAVSDLNYDLKYFKKLSDENYDKYVASSKQLLDMECERNALKAKCVFLRGNMDEAVKCWSVTLPIQLMCDNKIVCIKAFRDVFPVFLREAKEEVERKMEHGEQLFNTFLTTEQMLMAVAAFEDRGERISVSDLEIKRVRVLK